MTAFRTCTAIGFVLLSCSFTLRCAAQEPSERELIAELRQEVVELRKAVAELTRRLEGHEYGQLPRVELAMPRRAVATDPATPPLPKNLRFPINIERGTAAPITPRIRHPWLR